MSAEPLDNLDLSDPSDERDVDLAQALATAFAALKGGLNTALPGVVLSYDPVQGTAEIQPAIRSRQEDGSTVQSPVILSVPVVFPGAGPWSLSWPLERGDEVLLIVSQVSLDEWTAQGGYKITAGDPRRFDLADAIAIPGLRSAPNKLAGAQLQSSAITLSSQSGSTRLELRADGVVTVTAGEVRLGDDSALPLAIAALVDARIGYIVGAFNTHSHVASGTPTSTPAVLIPSQASVAATKAKGV